MIAGATVAILDRENGIDEYARRLQGILADRPAAAREAVRDRLRYYAWPSLKLEDRCALPRAFRGVDLVIFDSTRQFLSSVGLGEDDSNEYARFAGALIEPLFRHDIATVTLDNTGHNEKARPRGSSTKGDLADVLFNLVAVEKFDAGNLEGHVRLELAHQRAGAFGSAFSMRLGAGKFGSFTSAEAGRHEERDQEGRSAEGRGRRRGVGATCAGWLPPCRAGPSKRPAALQGQAVQPATDLRFPTDSRPVLGTGRADRFSGSHPYRGEPVPEPDSERLTSRLMRSTGSHRPRVTGTSLSITQARADLIAEWVAARRDLVRAIEDIQRLPQVSGWHPAILAAAIEHNLATGRFAEDAAGALLVEPQPPAVNENRTS